MEELEYLGQLEQILTEHRAFGDSAYIHRQADICYERRLDDLATTVPEAGAVRDALLMASTDQRRRVLGNTVVRFAVNSALRRRADAGRPGLPLDECREVFRATIEWLAARP